MMKWYSVLLVWILIIVFSLSSCKSNKYNQSTQTLQDQTASVDSIIQTYFGSDDSIEIIPSDKGNLQLYLYQDTVSTIEPIVNIRFLVYNKINDKILYKNNYSRASITWFNNTQLLLTRYSGIVDKQNGISKKQYLIDVETQKIKEYNLDNKTNQ